MADGVLNWAKRQRADWERSVDAMQAGKLKMHENGKDVTLEWTAYLLGKIAEVEELIAKHEAKSSKGA